MANSSYYPVLEELKKLKKLFGFSSNNGDNSSEKSLLERIKLLEIAMTNVSSNISKLGNTYTSNRWYTLPNIAGSTVTITGCGEIISNQDFKIHKLDGTSVGFTMSNNDIRITFNKNIVISFYDKYNSGAPNNGYLVRLK